MILKPVFVGCVFFGGQSISTCSSFFVLMLGWFEFICGLDPDFDSIFEVQVDDESLDNRINTTIAITNTKTHPDTTTVITAVLNPALLSAVGAGVGVA